MIRSMTGYGSAVLDDGNLRASVTARSLNHRFLDVSVHLPRRLQPIEIELRERVAQAVSRGRVEIAVQALSTEGGANAVVASKPLVASLVRTLRDMQNEFGLEGGASVADVIRFPGAIEKVEDLDSPPAGLREPVFELLRRALEGLNAMRQAEGERLRSDLERGLLVVEDCVTKIEGRSLASREERRAALIERVRGLVAELGLDEPRLYQEAVRALERHDVTEEIQRLRSHAAAVRALLHGDGEAPGKRLDFLSQELLREANTIGSKIQDATAVQEVVRLKSEIEKFREQVQNLE